MPLRNRPFGPVAVVGPVDPGDGVGVACVAHNESPLGNMTAAPAAARFWLQPAEREAIKPIALAGFPSAAHRPDSQLVR